MSPHTAHCNEAALFPLPSAPVGPRMPGTLKGGGGGPNGWRDIFERSELTSEVAPDAVCLLELFELPLIGPEDEAATRLCIGPCRAP